MAPNRLRNASKASFEISAGWSRNTAPFPFRSPTRRRCGRPSYIDKEERSEAASGGGCGYQQSGRQRGSVER
eukprot:scaffold51163_cov29-Tisochrysis_lutea.AAC.4